MFESIAGKYRNIVIAVAVFLILDASVLILNFYISFEISEDALGVNLAGRQRMLSQRMVKSVFDADYSYKDARQQRVALRELKETVYLFNRTLIAFDVGGETLAADGSETPLAAVRSVKARAAINNTKVLWRDYKQILDRLDAAQAGEGTSEALKRAIDYGRSHNLQILNEMNKLTVELEAIASSKAWRLRLIQTVGICLAVINFFIILFHLIRQLEESDKQVEIARGETLEILESVNEGVFLIDKNYKIGAQYSRSLERMFARTDLAGLSFGALLGGIVSKKDLDIAERFIALLFRSGLKRNLIGDLNPLRQVELHIPHSSGVNLSKYFSFQFECGYRDETMKDILVTVVDISDKVALERELRPTEENTDAAL